MSYEVLCQAEDSYLLTFYFSCSKTKETLWTVYTEVAGRIWSNFSETRWMQPKQEAFGKHIADTRAVAALLGDPKAACPWGIK